MRTVLPLVLVVSLSGALAAAPRQAPLLPYARQALDLGQTRDEALFAAFNRGYELATNEVIQRAEIVTEFRRAVLIVREQANRGELAFSAHDLSKAMEPYETAIGFVVEARLHPLHTYANTPAYALYVETGPRSAPLPPRPFVRSGVFPPGMVGARQTVVAVHLEGSFQRQELAASAAPTLVVTDDQANVIWKTRIDLSRYR